MAKLIWNGFWTGGHSLWLIASCIIAYRCSPWGSQPDQSLMALAMLLAVFQAHAVLASIMDALCKE